MERIASQAAAESGDTGGVSGGLLGIGSRGDLAARPEVGVELVGQSASVSVDLTVAYPAPIRAVTEEVRSHIMSRVRELSGVQVTRVDITVTALHRRTPQPRRWPDEPQRRPVLLVAPAAVTHGPGRVGRGAAARGRCGAGVVERGPVGQRRWPAWVGAGQQWAAAQTWGSASMITVSVVVALLGLLLLVVALTPGQLTGYRVQPAASADQASPRNTEVVMSRGAVGKLATAQANLVDGVDAASAVVTGRAVKLRVYTPSAHRSDVEHALTDRVSSALSAAGLSPMPTVTASVRSRRS